MMITIELEIEGDWFGELFLTVFHWICIPGVEKSSGLSQFNLWVSVSRPFYILCMTCYIPAPIQSGHNAVRLSSQISFFFFLWLYFVCMHVHCTQSHKQENNSFFHTCIIKVYRWNETPLLAMFNFKDTISAINNYRKSLDEKSMVV